MRTRKSTQLVHEGSLAAEVSVELLDGEYGWGPYLSLGDAEKLDEVRAALRRGDVQAASRLAQVYELKPIAAE